jgi:hypothetical protein
LETKQAATDALTKRIAFLRKAYAKGLGHRPSALQSAAILRAARLTALSEQAALSPETSANDLVRLDGAAYRARRDMAAILNAANREKDRPSLDAYLQAHREVAT